MRRFLIAIGIIMIVSFFLGLGKISAQEQADGQWTSFTTSNGLPYNEVAAIAFGPEGDLWCALVHPGGGGLAHFDGNTWEHHTSADGLGSDALLWTEHTLAVSSDNVLWVATFDAGVSRYDGETWTTYTTADGLLSDNVTSLAIAPDGELWCTHMMPECGISRFDGENWTVYSSADMGVPSCHLVNIAFGPDSVLWASGGDYVIHYNDESWTSFIPQTGLEVPLAFYMDIGPDGRVWIGTIETEVSCYEGSSWTHYTLADMGAKARGELMPLAVDAENILWVGVSGENEDDQEVIRYDGQSWTAFESEEGPALANVYTITVGPDSTIWFGTDYGLFGYKKKVPLTSIPHNSENKLTIYPNPFSDWIAITGCRNIEACIYVFNVMGDIILEEDCKGKNEYILNTAKLPKGIYFIEIASNDHSTAYKMIK
jgi:ligand-binding sensor domain-containing protein